jgi:hypothetical protein
LICESCADRATYTPAVTLDPIQERQDVHRTYARVSRSELAWPGFGLVVLLVLDRFFSIDWWAYALGALALTSWEITKYRLRRNADRFAGSRT